MGRLHDKIVSYNETNAIAFNESYVLPPTQTGSSSFGSADWLSDGNTTPVFNAASGPFPGEGSWYFNNTNVSPNAIRSRISNTHGTGNSSTITTLIEQCNYTVGFWIKVNNFNDILKTSPGIHRAVSSNPGVLPQGNIFYQIGIGWTDVTTPTERRAFVCVFNNAITVIDKDHNNVAVTTDKWYYLAVRKTTNTGNGNSGSTATTDFYINGYKYATTTATVTAGNVNQLNWGLNSTTANIQAPVHIANWHLASSSEINEAAIQAIWAAGAPIQVPVRHWDGSAWVDSVDEQIYYQSQWNPMYANKWTGTEWVAI